MAYKLKRVNSKLSKLKHVSGLSLKKTPHVWLAPKQHSIAMACNLESHAILLRVINVKLNNGKKITGLEIITLNREKIQHVSRFTELMFTGELHCLHGCFRKQTVSENV